jgi:hypothetical protein
MSSVAEQLWKVEAVIELANRIILRPETHVTQGEYVILGAAIEHLKKVRAAIESIEARQGDEDALREKAEANVLAARGSYDAPGFEACVEAEIAALRQPQPSQHTIPEEEAVGIIMQYTRKPGVYTGLTTAADAYRALSSQAHIVRKEPSDDQ